MTASLLLWLRRGAGVALALLVLSIVVREGIKLDWAAAWHDVIHANPVLLVAAVIVFAAAVPIRTFRWRLLLRGATPETLPSFPRMVAILIEGWAGNCVTVAQLGDVWRATLLQNLAGIPRAMTLGTILVERLIDLGVLALLLLGATLTIAGTKAGDMRSVSALAAGGVTLGALAVVVLARWQSCWPRWMPPRFAAILTTLLAGVRHALPQTPVAAALSAAGWLLEGAMIWLLAQAIGAPLSPAGALVAALIGALLTAIPVTPSGLGFTEAGLVLVLLRFGLAADAAVALMILVRLLTYWGVVGTGLVLFLHRRRNRRALEQRELESPIGQKLQEGVPPMTTTPSLHGRRAARPHDEVTVEIVIPVYNEEAQLVSSVETLRAYLDIHFPYRWTVTMADNASTDRTLAIAEYLTADPRICVVHLDQKGRGRALKATWLASPADVVAYMDVDLSTNLESFLPLVAPLISGHSDIAIGSRLARGAIVTRQWKREVLSRGYNLLIKTLFRNGFSDAQCGFKALTRNAAQTLVPLVEDTTWFFDTELLLLAEERGYRIHEVPVAWVEDLDSRVDIARTVGDDLKGLWRVRARSLRRLPHPALRPIQP
ncbi:MAG: flippase-like domain-containing protein [Thermomicrobiales bacterium]